MSEQRFKTLTPETMTPEQRTVAEAIQAGPRGAGLRGPFNALLRSPELCDLVQRVGAYVRFKSALPAALNEMAICMAGRKWTAQYEFYAHRRLALEAGRKIVLVPVPWQLLYAAFRTAEGLGLKLGFKSDSIVSFIYQNPAPDFAVQARLGINPPGWVAGTRQ